MLNQALLFKYFFFIFKPSLLYELLESFIEGINHQLSEGIFYLMTIVSLVLINISVTIYDSQCVIFSKLVSLFNGHSIAYINSQLQKITIQYYYQYFYLIDCIFIVQIITQKILFYFKKFFYFFDSRCLK